MAENADMPDIPAAPAQPVTVIKTPNQKLLVNRGFLTPTTFERLLVPSIDSGTHEAAKAFCWNIFNASDTLSREMTRRHARKEIINIGEGAMTMAARTNAIGFPRMTNSLVKIYTHSIEYHTSVTPFPQPPKVEKVVDLDNKMAEAVPAPVVAPPPPPPAPVVEVKVAAKVDQDSDEEEEEVIPKSTRRKAPAPKKPVPAKKKRGKAKKESSDEFEVEHNDDEEAASEFEEEPIPEDPLREAKIAFRVQHVLDLVEIKRLIDLFKDAAEQTEKFMLKYFAETPLDPDDKPSAEQEQEYKDGNKAAKEKVDKE